MLMSLDSTRRGEDDGGGPRRCGELLVKDSRVGLFAAIRRDGLGDSGTGKSHLLIALGTEAVMAGYRVKYTLATKLANELVEAADELVLSKTIARYGRVDLLCIDELGYMQLDRRGAELLFQVLTEREDKNSVAIASNESFAGRTKTFTDPRLCAAIEAP